jgi:hypothetical protein
MIKIIREEIKNGILLRMFWNNSHKNHPVTVQIINDDSGERIETRLYKTPGDAEEYYNKYLNINIKNNTSSDPMVHPGLFGVETLQEELDLIA